MSSKVSVNRWLLLLSAALALHLAFHLASGPVEMGDTSRYLGGADEFLETGVIDGKASNYRGYIVFVAALKTLTDDPGVQKWLIVLGHAGALAAAFFCLYSLGRMLFSETAGLVAAGLYTANFYALRWTPYLATESLFMAFVVIACWFCVKSSRAPAWVLPAIVVSVFAASIRPNGVAMLPVFLLFFLLTLNGRMRAVIFAMLLVAGIALAPAAKDAIDGLVSHEDLTRRFEDGSIITKIRSMDMPELADKSGDQIADVLRYIAAYPAETAILAGRRLFAAWIWYREDYSARHNLILVLALPVLYGFALAGLVSQIRRGFTNEHLLPVLLIAAQSAVIAISWANHDHRFINGVMPLVFLYAAAGLAAAGRGFTGRIADPPPILDENGHHPEEKQ